MLHNTFIKKIIIVISRALLVLSVDHIKLNSKRLNWRKKSKRNKCNRGGPEGALLVRFSFVLFFLLLGLFVVDFSVI